MDRSRLSTIMTPRVVSVEKHHKVLEAVSVMGSKNIGSIAVLDDKSKLCGIITERDVLRAFSKGKDLGSLSVSDIMTSKVVTASPDTTILQGAKTMVKNQFRRLPVVDGENMVGIVTSTDLIVEMDSPHINGMVSDYMSKKTLGVESTATVSEAVGKMVENKIGGLIVFQGGKSTGIITERDIIRGILSLGAKLGRTPVSEIMSRDLISVEKEMQVNHICHLMHYYGVRRFPVIDSNEDIIGMVTEKDLLKAMVDSYA